MPAHRVTAEAASRILEWKKQGRSSRDIAGSLLSEFGIQLDQRTISRYAKRGRPDPGRSRPIPARPEPISVPESTEGPLDEVATLERQVEQLRSMLEVDLPPRDWAALNAELRQTFGAIRKAKKATREAAALESADTSWVVAKLKRFAAMKPDMLQSPNAGDTDRAEAAGEE